MFSFSAFLPEHTEDHADGSPAGGPTKPHHPTDCITDNPSPPLRAFSCIAGEVGRLFRSTGHRIIPFGGTVRLGTRIGGGWPRTTTVPNTTNDLAGVPVSGDNRCT